MTDFRYITYDTVEDGTIARITLNRPQVRNAQNRGLLVELGDAMLTAESDDRVRVVVLGGAGPLFSAGHDLGTRDAQAEQQPGGAQHPTYQGYGATRLATEARWTQEWHFYFTNTLRWRNLRKITVAQVQGTVYAAGLMLMWACDLIVAADDTQFVDVVGTRLGMCGVEYFAHPWEFGPRRAKEMLLTGDSLGVEEAYRLGMVSKIFPRDNMAADTLAYARRLARMPTAAALMIKESVNQTVDNMGFYNALQACFSLHQMNHAHWGEVNGDGRSLGTPEHGVPAWNDAPAIVPLSKSVADPHGSRT